MRFFNGYRMIVKCISTSSSSDRTDALHYRWLTLDKIYRLVEIRNNSHYVMDDSEEVYPYPKHCFMDISEWRDKQIEKVINVFL